MRNPKRKKDLVFNKLNDQLIIINFNSTKQFHQANDVGARIWELCDGFNSTEQILEKLSEEFDEDSSIIAEDLNSYLSLLKENELLDY
jgi:hypothetical protein